MKKAAILFVFFCVSQGLYAQLSCQFLSDQQGRVYFHITNITDTTVYFNWKIYDPRQEEYSYNNYPERLAAGETLSLDESSISWAWLKGETIELFPLGGGYQKYICPLYDLVFESEYPYNKMKRMDVYYDDGTPEGTCRYNPRTWRVLFRGKYYELKADKYHDDYMWLDGTFYYVIVK